MNKGFIKLWRSSVDNPLYFAEPFTKWQAWVDLLILANHKPNTVSVRGILINVDRGQVLAGEKFLADRWKWSRGKVRRFQSYLSSKTVQQTVQQKDNVCTLLSIVNYNRYQDVVQQTVQQTDIRKTPDGHQTDTLKNDKNEENEKNTDSIADASASAEKESSNPKPSPSKETWVAPTLQEVTAWAAEWAAKHGKPEPACRTVAVDAFNYYKRRDWYDAKEKRVKSWKRKIAGVWFSDEKLGKTKQTNIGIRV